MIFMKAFISVDLEGLPYVVIPGHLTLKGSLYSEARKIATKITRIVIDELANNDFTDILIADSHGPMVNLEIDDLPEYVEIIRGTPRPVSMVAGIEDGCDVALFLGYHAKFGTARSSFDHTYSGRSIHSLVINDVPLSEFLLNAYVAGMYDVPVILVAGEAQLLKDDVQKYTPWAETVTLKESLSRVSAKSASLVKIEAELKKAVQTAVKNFKTNKVHPLKVRQPLNIEITFLASHFADVAELLPIVKRISGLTVQYTTKDIIEAYKIFQLLVIAAAGMSSFLDYVQ